MHDNNVALVTGANQGIGFQVARDLAARGLTVLLGSRDAARGEAAAAQIDGDVHVVQLDVTSDTSIAAAAELVRERFGRLDVLVNNAGVSFLGDPDTPLMERAKAGLLTTMPIDEVRRMYEVNVFGPLALTQAVLPLLLAAPAARVVVVGSGGSSLTMNADPTYAGRSMFGIYPATKSALHAVALGLATALESTNVVVNIADPGFTATALNGFQGTRTVEEGAAHVVTLALLGEDAPTGTFTSDEGDVPW